MQLHDATGWNKQLFVQVPSFSRKRLLHSVLHSPRFEGVLRHQFMNAVPAYRGIRDHFVEAQLEFFAAARRFCGASIYLDGTKSIRRAQLFARDGRCDMKILHLVRDGRGFCASYLKHIHPVPTWAEAARVWLSDIEQLDHFSRVFPSVSVLTVRYEDLCRSTAETIRSVYRFLGIACEELGTDVMKDAHILGNRMRRTFSGAIVEDTSWQEKLDDGTQLRLTALMRRQLERFGYL